MRMCVSLDIHTHLQVDTDTMHLLAAPKRVDLVCMHARTHTCSRRADGYRMATATKCGRAELERCPALRNGDGNRSEDGGSHVFLFFFGRISTKDVDVPSFYRALKTPMRTVRALAVALTVLSSLLPRASGGMIDLVACAEVENVARIGVPSDHTFFLRLTCTTCRSEFPNAVGVSSSMVVEGIKGMRTPLSARPAPWRNSLARRQALAVTARLLRRARSRARFAANGRCAHRTWRVTGVRVDRGVGECADEMQRMRPRARHHAPALRGEQCMGARFQGGVAAACDL